MQDKKLVSCRQMCQSAYLLRMSWFQNSHLQWGWKRVWKIGELSNHSKYDSRLTGKAWKGNLQAVLHSSAGRQQLCWRQAAPCHLCHSLHRTTAVYLNTIRTGFSTHCRQGKSSLPCPLRAAVQFAEGWLHVEHPCLCKSDTFPLPEISEKSQFITLYSSICCDLPGVCRQTERRNVPAGLVGLPASSDGCRHWAYQAEHLRWWGISPNPHASQWGSWCQLKSGLLPLGAYVHRERGLGAMLHPNRWKTAAAHFVPCPG